MGGDTWFSAGYWGAWGAHADWIAPGLLALVVMVAIGIVVYEVAKWQKLLTRS